MSLFANPYIKPNSDDGGGEGSVELSNSITSSSTTTAASSLAVKLVNDKVGEMEGLSSEIESKASSVHDHDSIYYKKQTIDDAINTLNSSLHKVKTGSNDTPDYLINKLDNTTIVVEDNEIKVKSMEGLIHSPEEIEDLLSGATGNIQSQIDTAMSLISSVVGGVDYKGKFETYEDLSEVDNKKNGDLAVVLSDEEYLDARTLRIYNETLGFWEFIGAFEFSDSFIALTDTPSSYADQNNKVLKVDETNDKIKFESINWSEISDKPSSTKTQIDNAVGKMHEHDNQELLDAYTKTNSELTSAVSQTHTHTNKTYLDKISANSQGILTYNGTPYTPTQVKQHLYARRGGTDQAIPKDTNLVFTSEINTDGGIPYDSTTGAFTLESGKVYLLDAYIHISGGYCTIEVRDSTTSQELSDALATTYANPVNRNNGYSSGGIITTIIKPTQTRSYVLRSVSGSDDTKMYRYASTLRIVEL